MYLWLGALFLLRKTKKVFEVDNYYLAYGVVLGAIYRLFKNLAFHFILQNVVTSLEHVEEHCCEIDVERFNENEELSLFAPVLKRDQRSSFTIPTQYSQL